MPVFTFPKDFLWGTATSAHQTEGNNKNSDWWKWEQTKDPNRPYPLEPSAKACDSYNRYEEDFNLCQDLNNNAVRISIEWARIQPTKNTFNKEELAHYKKVLKAAQERNLKTFVTLHHFTNPLWFVKKGGWLNPTAPKYFAKYAQVCAQELGDLIDVFLTINEPQVYVLEAYVRGMWPPNKKNLLLSLMAQINLLRAHTKAYKAIKSVNSRYKVGLVKNIVWYEYLPSKLAFIDKVAARILYFVGNGLFLKPIKNCLDLIGLNYYFTTQLKGLRVKNKNDIVSDLGWWVYPKGLEHILLELKKYKLPIYVTENGTADKADRIREEFLEEMLKSCARAIKQGVALQGYFYWSLIDNYEWHQGFWPKFGLVYIERDKNLRRIPRKSFHRYADICKDGKIDL